MDARLFSARHPLLWLWSVSAQDLRQLRSILRERRGGLRWTGEWCRPDIPERIYSRAEQYHIGKTVLRDQASPQLFASLPSEERKARALEQIFHQWQGRVSTWQIVVPGEPSWTPEEAQVWKRALDRVVGRWLWIFLRLQICKEGIGERGHYLKRRLVFFIRAS